MADLKIVYGSSADDTLKNAALNLSRYAGKAFDCDISCIPASDIHEEPHNIIFVGKTDFDTARVKDACKGLYNCGIAIVADGDNLYLTGENETGAMYAVYTFLEDFVGWRFYSSKFETLVPDAAKDLPQDACITYSPKLFNRDTFWFDSFDVEFASKLKLNGGVTRSRKGYGALVKYAGPFVHTLPGLAGTPRVPDVQPCLTDPEVYEKVLGNVRNLLKENPDAKIISVSQNDSHDFGLGCQCDKCKAIDEREGTPMGSLLTFVNRIADDIKDDYPDVFVDTLAYRYTRKAPKSIRPRDNVIIRLCSIECCFSHTLDSDCPRNVAFRKDIEDWAKISKNLFIWDYTTDFLFYVIPFPNLKVLYDNVRFFVDHNVIGLFEQGNGQSQSGEFGELRAYMLAKVMWDPDMPREKFEELVDDFLKGYYGPGWKYVKEYIDKVCALSGETHMGIYDFVQNNLSIENKDEASVIEELEGLWKKALEASDELHYENVEKSSLQIYYTKLLRLWHKDTSPMELKDMYSKLKKYNITHFREGVKLPVEPDFNKPLAEW